MATLPFASSNGGPVAVVPVELAKDWRGLADEDFYATFLERSTLVKRTEYGGFSTMKLGKGVVLLFDGEIHTTWLKEESGGTFIREGCAHTAARAKELVASVPDKAWKRFTTLTLRDGGLIVLDSALPASGKIVASNGLVKAKLTPGPYRVDIAALGGIDLARLRPR